MRVYIEDLRGSCLEDTLYPAARKGIIEMLQLLIGKDVGVHAYNDEALREAVEFNRRNRYDLNPIGNVKIDLADPKNRSC